MVELLLLQTILPLSIILLLIALVSMFSKVFESCLAEKVIFEKHFDSLQYGFTKERSCPKALLTFEKVCNYYICRGSVYGSLGCKQGLRHSQLL